MCIDNISIIYVLLLLYTIIIILIISNIHWCINVIIIIYSICYRLYNINNDYIVTMSNYTLNITIVHIHIIIL